MTRPLVSVVIPCYKQARFLEGAIESVLGQTYSPIETVVVDDGSPDDVAGVAAAYPSIRLVRTSNQGLAAARNNGLAAATGTLCVFLDADDRLLPDAVAQGIACLDRDSECGMVFGRHVRVGRDGTRVDDPPSEVLAGDPYAALLRGNIVGAVCAALWRREAVEAVGGFDRTLPAVEDYDLALRVAQRFAVAQHDGIVAEILRHDAGMHRDFALMLKWTVLVLRRQRQLASRTSAYREAYRHGLRTWRLTYGVRLARRAVRGLGSPATLPASVRDIGVLLRYYPGVVLHGARRAPALAQRRLLVGRPGKAMR